MWWNQQGPHGPPSVMDVHVATLRRKLRDYGERIVTIRGVGYKFDDRQQGG